MSRSYALVPLHRAALLLGSCLGLALPAAHAETKLADQPVFAKTAVPGNLALALSVEFPTAISVAHTDTVYDGAKTYLGYFDSNKCYLYYHVATETATDKRHFYPAGAAISRACTGAQDDKWSGNFLNWATMQTVDPFRSALTGGYRVVDTVTTTILEKAHASAQGSTTNFPDRNAISLAVLKANTPFGTSSTWALMNIRVYALGNKMRFSGVAIAGAVTDLNPASNAQPTGQFEASVRVKVCDTNVAAGPLEANCKLYGTNAKPEGLLQQYADRIRYSAFGYLNDSSVTRDGGVLRAQQKFVGPNETVPAGVPIANPAREWDPATGIMAKNPDAADASATATLFGTPVNDSGVINYLNKFGQINPSTYKTYDPVGELYYAAIRYFKNLGNVPEWSAKSGNTGTNATWVDGFPVITSWNDPLQYSCQKNFVLGIGDVNTHADKNVPGNTPSANEPGKPSLVSADTSVNAVTATNKIGALHGLGASLGTTNPYNGCCTNNSALMAGLAYDSNTKDIRPDNVTVPKTKGKQTVQTYWLDILEFQQYKANNQFYLAAKYGGFKVPDDFDPYTRATDIPKAWWSTTGETVYGQDRPDTYYVASRPDQMVAGLTRAFKDIADQLSGFSASLSTSLPQVASSGAATFAAKFDSNNWTSDVLASTLSFSAAGEATQAQAWSFSSKLTAQLAGTGWSSNRVVLTIDPNAAQGARGRPFRALTDLTGAQQTALDTTYRTGTDALDYLNYLRGDKTHEVGSTATGSAKAYRARSGPMGDVINSKLRVVPPPSSPFSVAANPGYSSFVNTWKDRPTMVYVGANDGMLHAINGKLTDANTGREVFAFVPNAVYAGPTGNAAETGLQHRGNPEFVHKQLVDGPVVVYDIDLGYTGNTAPVARGTANWRSVLVGGLGKGGKSYYAIDVTDPGAFGSETLGKAKVMWEFTDPDLGYTYGEPQAVKTKAYGWVLVFGSGYNNSSGKGFIFFVNPATGELIKKVEAKNPDGSAIGTPANPAGLAHVQAFVLDRTDDTAETIYAGDLLGNLWRLDVNAASGDYAALGKLVKLAELRDTAGNPVPVTTRPLAIVHPKTNRRYVTVGSGRLLDSSDIGNTQPQAFFAILDGTGNGFATTLPAPLAFPVSNGGSNNRLRKLTDLTTPITLDFSTEQGWWLDLGTATGGLGWRVISPSVSFLGAVTFAPMVPKPDPCSPGGESRVYSIDLGTGKSKLLNADNTTAPYLTPVPGVVTDIRNLSINVDNKGKFGSYVCDDLGNCGTLKTEDPSALGVRRLNWRELPLAD